MSEERKDGTIESDMVEENSNIVEKQEAVFADEEVNTNQVESDAKKEKDEEKEKKPLSKRILSGVMELMLYVVIALVCIFVIPKFVVQRTEVSGPSMESTLHDKDSILVEKLSYRFGEPKRFDVIIFYHFFEDEYEKDKEKVVHDKNDQESYDFYVKRVIGLPGETVQIVDETIYINGEPLEENYGKDPITYEGIASEPIKLGEDEYFVLGDNREVSQDSRYEEVGNVKKDLIVGKAWLRVYPFNKICFLAID